MAFFFFGCVRSLLLREGFRQLLCVGFSLWWLLLLRSTGSRAHGLQQLWHEGSLVVARGLSSCGSRALERSLSSCGPRAQLLRSMWTLPRSGLEPVSPALAGRFLTTAPPGKSQNNGFNGLNERTFFSVLPHFLLLLKEDGWPGPLMAGFPDSCHKRELGRTEKAGSWQQRLGFEQQIWLLLAV